MRYKKTSELLSSHNENTNLRAFVADDSLLPKTGEKTEFISRVHDHVSGKFIFGYKLLVLGYWDRGGFYPLDFSLHREKGSRVHKAQEKLKRAQKRLITKKKKSLNTRKLAQYLKKQKGKTKILIARLS